jgi:hypothetical protein
LESFYSLATKTGSGSELGILTSYDTKIGLNTGLIKGQPNLNPVKQLLLSDSIELTNNEYLKLTNGDDNNE